MSNLCPYCGSPSVVEMPGTEYCRCENCGREYIHEYKMVMPDYSAQYQMYKEMEKSKGRWRLVFVLLELASFFVALGLCWLFAEVLDTNVFVEHNYIIFLVWIGVAVHIYRSLRSRIM